MVLRSCSVALSLHESLSVRGLLRSADILVFLLALLYAEPGYACSVCSVSGLSNSDMFTWSTIFLSAMPFVAVGGTVLWLRWALRRQVDNPEDRFA